MRNHFLDQIVIEREDDPSKPQLIYSSHLSVADITSVSQQSTSQVEDTENDDDSRQDIEQDKANILTSNNAKVYQSSHCV